MSLSKLQPRAPQGEGGRLVTSGRAPCRQASHAVLLAPTRHPSASGRSRGGPGRGRPDVQLQSAAEAGPLEAPATAVNDVYASEPEFFEEGTAKHLLSVFVADEAGLINRVAGVFARRGANIETLAVGLNVDKALFTIEVAGTESTVANLVKQLGKLVKVRYVEDVTYSTHIEREMVLFKVRGPPGPARTEIFQLVEVFRARIIDIADQTVTICCTGDSGKALALQRALGKYGIAEVARTGKICLKRGEELLEMGGWGDGQAARRQRTTLANPGANPGAGPSQPQPGQQPHRAGGDGVGPAAGDGAAGALAAAQDGSSTAGGDVYTASDGLAPGVWEVRDILSAEYGAAPSEFEPHTLSLIVEDVPGVLNQVTGVFARRGYSVQSLAVGSSERQGQSRVTMVVPGSSREASIPNLIKQLHKLVHVVSVTDLTSRPLVRRELMLIKVRCRADQRQQLQTLAEIFRGTVCDVSPTTLTLELQGKEDKMAALQAILQPYGILEIARTGRVALARDSGVDSRYLTRLKRAASLR